MTMMNKTINTPIITTKPYVVLRSECFAYSNPNGFLLPFAVYRVYENPLQLFYGLTNLEFAVQFDKREMNVPEFALGYQIDVINGNNRQTMPVQWCHRFVMGTNVKTDASGMLNITLPERICDCGATLIAPKNKYDAVINPDNDDLVQIWPRRTPMQNWVLDKFVYNVFNFEQLVLKSH